jgi:hypothetical protein
LALQSNSRLPTQAHAQIQSRSLLCRGWAKTNRRSGPLQNAKINSTPETLVTQMRQLYRAGYVRRLTARGANDPSYDFIATTANREDIKSQTKVDTK